MVSSILQSDAKADGAQTYPKLAAANKILFHILNVVRPNYFIYIYFLGVGNEFLS